MPSLSPPPTSSSTAPSHPVPPLAWSVRSLTWLLAGWLATAGNLPLWQQVWALPEVGGLRGALFIAGFGVLVFGLLTATLALCAWPRAFKPMAVLALLSAAGASHFMREYSTVIDPSMLLNVIHTDAREVRDLLSPGLLWTLLWVGVAPSVWLWRQPVAWQQPQTGGWKPWLGWAGKRLLRNLGLIVLGLALGAAALMAIFQDFASVMRNHKQVRYLINPLNSFYAVTSATLASAPHATKPLLPIGEDARLGPTYAPQARPLLLVMVVGETARAANFSFNGYPRQTTPLLAELARTDGLLWFGNTRSCGTNTQASVPCMFSHHGKQAHEASKDRYENLVDVLQRAGLAVTWIDNQSGCKGVCDRVPNINTREGSDPQLCPGGECLDGIMLKTLPEQLKALPADARQRGTVVVFHQMGNHGPAYFKRSPASHKAFQPECTQNALQACAREEVVNAYDNALRYTDQVLADTIAWLKTQDADTGLIYMSDHGESLGENNLYLHGLPYAIAPDEQKQVPWVTWLSPALKKRLNLDDACLRTLGERAWSHDNLFHSLLGLADVQTQVYQAAMNAFGTCTRPQ